MPRHATSTSFKPGRIVAKVPISQRLISGIAVSPDGCWLWNGNKCKGGYGRIFVDGKLRQVHRVSYETFVAAIPDELDLDHKCHNPKACAGGATCQHRRCINPDHLEPVTRKENVKRGHGNKTVVANRKARTHCKYNHEYTPENTYWYRGYRMCRKCHCLAECRRQAIHRQSASVQT